MKELEILNDYYHEGKDDEYGEERVTKSRWHRGLLNTMKHLRWL